MFILAEVPDLHPQLEKLTLSYLDFKGKTDQQTDEVQDLYKKYNKIVSFQSQFYFILLGTSQLFEISLTVATGEFDFCFVREVG